jgi:hypothetical protein
VHWDPGVLQSRDVALNGADRRAGAECQLGSRDVTWCAGAQLLDQGVLAFDQR